MEERETIGMYATPSRNTAAAPYSVGRDRIAFYAERRNSESANGEYGGDAYPIVWEEDVKAGKSGLILVSDGVGAGAFVHDSLREFVSRYEREEEKLARFLLDIYGKEIFDEENREALDYALRSFSEVPPDSFYITRTGIPQAKMPFYERDSQSLASRIVCVGLFLRFRHFARDRRIESWTEENAELLRAEAERYLDTELRGRISRIFDNEKDGQTARHREVFFLPCTLAAWFYLDRRDANEADAVCLTVGDARCYKVDPADGVKQISTDDAFEDNSMSAIIHYGQKKRCPPEFEGYSDCTLKKRRVRLKKPCALFACSDGIYDTCSGLPPEGSSKLGLGYGDTDECCDVAFERNFLEVIRQSNGTEDFRQLAVRCMYAQCAADGFSETSARRQSSYSGSFGHVKPDDSGTFGMRVFADGGIYGLVGALRAAAGKTTIERLWEAMKSTQLAYTPPVGESVQERRREAFAAFAKGEFLTAFRPLFAERIARDAEKVFADGAKVLWGAEFPYDTVPGGFTLNTWFKRHAPVFAELMCDDFAYLIEHDGVIPEEWNAGEHILLDRALFRAAEKFALSERTDELYESVREDPVFMRKKEEYALFCRLFEGKRENGEDLGRDAEAIAALAPSDGAFESDGKENVGQSLSADDKEEDIEQSKNAQGAEADTRQSLSTDEKEEDIEQSGSADEKEETADADGGATDGETK